MIKKIAFDISCTSGKNKSGVQNVVLSYIAGFLLSKKKHDIIFYDRSGYFNKNLSHKLHDKYKSINFLKNNFFSLFFKFSKNFLSYKFDINDRLNHVWHWEIFTGNSKQNSITIHDLLPIEFPELFTSREIYLKKKSLIFALHKADYVVFISHSTKRLFFKLYGVPNGKIKVIYNGINPIFFNKFDNRIRNKVLDKYGLLNKNFFISYGYLDPRKNILRQLKAFELFMSSQKNINYYYVLTGFLNKNSSTIIKNLNKFKFKERIKFIGYVEDQDLVYLINQAKAVLFCSLGEGFGLPLIEAMTQKTPVITSNLSSMRELGNKNKAILVDPFKENSIKNAMISISNNNYKKKIDINKSFRFSKKFTIKKMFNNYMEFFND